MVNLPNNSSLFTSKGWECPKCGAVMSPSFPTCFYCKPVITEINNDNKSDCFLDKSIYDLELTVRSTNCLRTSGINTIRELINIPKSSLVKILNFGRKSLKEIEEALKKHGLYLNDE